MDSFAAFFVSCTPTLACCWVSYHTVAVDACVHMCVCAVAQTLIKDMHKLSYQSCRHSKCSHFDMMSSSILEVRLEWRSVGVAEAHARSTHIGCIEPRRLRLYVCRPLYPGPRILWIYGGPGLCA